MSGGVATGLEVEAFTLTLCGVREVLREHGYVEEESFVSLSLISVVRRCLVRFIQIERRFMQQLRDL